MAVLVRRVMTWAGDANPMASRARYERLAVPGSGGGGAGDDAGLAETPTAVGLVRTPVGTVRTPRARARSFGSTLREDVLALVPAPGRPESPGDAPAGPTARTGALGAARDNSPRGSACGGDPRRCEECGAAAGGSDGGSGEAAPRGPAGSTGDVWEDAESFEGGSVEEAAGGRCGACGGALRPPLAHAPPPLAPFMAPSLYTQFEARLDTEVCLLMRGCVCVCVCV